MSEHPEDVCTRLNSGYTESEPQPRNENMGNLIGFRLIPAPSSDTGPVHRTFRIAPPPRATMRSGDLENFCADATYGKRTESQN